MLTVQDKDGWYGSKYLALDSYVTINSREYTQQMLDSRSMFRHLCEKWGKPSALDVRKTTGDASASSNSFGFRELPTFMFLII